MKYTFKCKNGHEKEINAKMGEVSKIEIICPICKEKMHQVWATAFNIPENMKAGEVQEMAWVNERLKNRPSGKRKVIY